MAAGPQTRRRRLLFTALFLTAGAPGCAEQQASFERMAKSEAPAPTAAAVAPMVDAAPGAAGMMMGMMAPARANAAPPGGAEVPPAVPRKIVYNAQVTLVVDSVTEVGDQLLRLVKESGGYVAESDVSSYTHTQRRATWKLRIPVDRFDGLLTAVGKLGEVQQNRVDSQDVTQEFYDLEARIANKQKEEQRLLKHLEQSTGKLEDILSVEREISRVRGEVEQMQGRLRYLANVTALSTVTVTATETRDYTPPVAPTFAGKLRRTFDVSVERLVTFLQDIVLGIVALLPWVPVVLVLALPVYFLIRRPLRKFLAFLRGTPAEPSPVHLDPVAPGDAPPPDL